MHYLVRAGITFHIAQAVRPREFDYQHRISLTSLIEMHDGVEVVLYVGSLFTSVRSSYAYADVTCGHWL